MITPALYDQVLVIVLVLAAFLTLAKLIDIIIPWILRRLVTLTTTPVDDQIIILLRRPLFISILLGGLLWISPTLHFSSDGLETFVKTIQSLLVLVWSWTLASVLVVFVTDVLTTREGPHHAADLLPFVRSMLRFGVIGLAFFYLFSLWGIDVTPILASAGVVGLAIALAAKDSLSNFFGGLSLFLDQAYKVGDYIIVDELNRGEVIEIGLRSTKIKTRDNVTLSVPNALMASSKVVNETGDTAHLRVRISVGVSYGSDLKAVEDVMLSVALGHEGVLDEPEPVVRFREFGDHSLQYELLAWIAEPHLKGHITHDLNTAIFYAFHNAHIVVPYPQLDIHMQKGVALEKRD